MTGPVSTPNSDLTPMRLHEVAMQWWCHQHFFVRDGFPTPVIFSKPMDAYMHYEEMWAKEQNPYDYLRKAKNENGELLYPWPAPARFPLIVINRKRQSFRPYGNFSTSKNRHVSWPTVSDNVNRNDLGSVRVRNRPIGLNFHFDIVHYCLRPDTQALFIQNVWNCFWRSGGTPQTWIKVVYPDDLGAQMVRMTLDSEITDTTLDDPGLQQSKCVTSFSVHVEGWQVDMADKVYPALWHNVVNAYAVDIGQLRLIYTKQTDLRDEPPKSVIVTRDGVPTS